MSTPQTSPPTNRVDRFELLMATIERLVDKVDDVEQHLGEIDRVLRPHGDGYRPPSRRRRR